MLQRIYKAVKSWFVKEDNALAKVILLHRCIEEGDVVFVESLLDAGADVYARTDDDMTALMRASFYGRTEIVKMLLDRGTLDLEDEIGFASLSIACLQRYKDTLRVLIARGSQVGIQGHNGSSALEIALYFEDKEIFDLLLKGGASLNGQDTILGQTMLMRASLGGNIEVVKILLAHGARVDIQDNEGASALTWARKKGYDEIVELLIQYGALDTNN